MHPSEKKSHRESSWLWLITIGGLSVSFLLVAVAIKFIESQRTAIDDAATLIEAICPEQVIILI
jgi:hypothetical protein